MEKINLGEFWEARYRLGKGAGPGSVGALRDYKVRTINGLIRKHNISSLLDVGCGDGEIAGDIDVDYYTGVDIAPSAIDQARRRLPGRQFFIARNVGALDTLGVGGMFDACISLDVLFHLVEDEDYIDHLELLFSRATKLVVIYSSDVEKESTTPHQYFRKFTSCIQENYPDWNLTEVLKNPYPYDLGAPNTTSISSFHVFLKV